MASPAVIKMCAVKGVLVPVPRLAGQVAQYVGRRVDHAIIKAGETDLDKCYPPDPEENSKFLRSDGNSILTELFRAARHGDLIPGDDVTAKWCGVSITPIQSTSLQKDDQ